MSELRNAVITSVRTGLILGVAAVFVALMGIVLDFNQLEVIGGVLGLGHTILLLIGVAAGYVAVKTTNLSEERRSYPEAGLLGAIAGLLMAGVLALLVLLIHNVNLRPVFVNATETLIAALTFNQSLGPGIVLLLAVGLVLGIIGGILNQLSPGVRAPILTGLTVVLLCGVLQEMFLAILGNFALPEGFIGFLYYRKGLTPLGAVSLLILTVMISAARPYLGPAISRSYDRFNPAGKTIVGTAVLLAVAILMALIFLRLPIPIPETIGKPVQAALVFGLLGLLPAAVVWFVARSRRQPAQRGRLLLRGSLVSTGVFVLATLPFMVGLYWTDVFDNFGLYVLMGLGLNVVIGFAGLLDLGYVAFFAIGAYTAGLFTSMRSSLAWGWSFWAAWPIALCFAAMAGIILGVPVLRMRGDYLAIVTLGFGEIIRVLALSDLLKPYIGGAQGILEIPKPTIGGLTLLTSQHLYYLILLGCLLAIFISWRLSDSRVGRAWIAIREDEDVAEAMGINLVQYKLFAFAIGALLAGVSGAIFASKLSSIYPHSFNLIISINVLCLIIVGGIASIPGVVVGAFAMLFLPEVLRFAAEYRYLMYGAALVVMMLVKPEGLWPAERRRRELHAAEEMAEEAA
ncbi:MAG: leucine/isoleucine/valine transporter permease subunit [Anaerolineales bacterium]|nr:MAG: leucine/isoleucine/valine transporter permease subunit [Anaerolineales bacterium]